MSGASILQYGIGSVVAAVLHNGTVCGDGFRGSMEAFVII